MIEILSFFTFYLGGALLLALGVSFIPSWTLSLAGVALIILSLILLRHIKKELKELVKKNGN